MAGATYGHATGMSLREFNDRVKRLLGERPDPKKGASYRRSWSPKPPPRQAG